MFNGIWKSDPENYSRLDYFKIELDRAQFVFGYGQTIFFDGIALLEFVKGNYISIQYLKVSGVSAVKLAVPCVTKVHFEYVEESGSFDVDIVDGKFHYDRVLRLDSDPFPFECDFPYSRQHVYYRRIVD